MQSIQTSMPHFIIFLQLFRVGWHVNIIAEYSCFITRYCMEHLADMWYNDTKQNNLSHGNKRFNFYLQVFHYFR